MPQVLQYVPLQSAVDGAFWTALANKKLDELKLSQTSVQINGRYSIMTRDGVPAFVRIDHSAFEAASCAPDSISTRGLLYNYNTLEGFRAVDHTAVMRQEAEALWMDIQTGQAWLNPALLTRFVLLTYADLKTWKFYYWFGFPAIKLPALPTLLTSCALSNAVPDQYKNEVHRLLDLAAMNPSNATTPASDWEGAAAARQSVTQPVWLLHVDATGTVSPHPLSSLNDLPQLKEGLPCSFPCTTQNIGHEADHEANKQADRKADAAYGAGQGRTGTKGEGGPISWSLPCTIVVTRDASHSPAHPCWPLRNVLALLSSVCGGMSVRVLSLRQDVRVDRKRSQLLVVDLPRLAEGWAATEAAGWERNLTGKLGPRLVDMRPNMDPAALSEQAVDLNIRLMRWRFAPGLDLKRLQNLRCLLLGSGTLGCAVARGLLGWRVSHLTMVDNGKVAFSNPVRQSLFTYQDCLEGGKPKAAAAAAALTAIFPSVTATGVDLAIPMPGHPISSDEHEKVRGTVQHLDELVASHHVVFMLTDTRESRWLPTLLAAKHHKLAITAALGFDEFVVVRHGLPTVAATPTGEGQGEAPGSSARLGCYFCNDVVAPKDSTRNRSLDQQCTVTRPGLASLAGACAAELCVNVVQHPWGASAPHSSSREAAEEGVQQGVEEGPSWGTGGGTVLGAVPHMVRGYLSSFGQSVFCGHAYPRCPACSPTVVDVYEQRGWDFILAALQTPAYLEELTGLSELHKDTDTLLEAAEDCGDGEAGSDDWTAL